MAVSVQQPGDTTGLTPAQQGAADAAAWNPGDISAAEQAQIASSANPAMAQALADMTGQNLAGLAPYGGTAQSGGWNTDFAMDLGALNSTVADLNSGNYSGAISAAEMNTNFAGGTAQSITQDSPIMQALLSSQGLQDLDPSKQWNNQSDQALIQALQQSDPSKLGVSTSGAWGSTAASTLANDWTQKNGAAAPDLNALNGATPTSSFYSKYGMPIWEAMGAAMMGPEVAAAAGGGVAGGAAAGAAIGATDSAINSDMSGNAITLGSLGKAATVGGVAGGVAAGLNGLGVPSQGSNLAGKYVGGQIGNAAFGTPGQGNSTMPNTTGQQGLPSGGNGGSPYSSYTSILTGLGGMAAPLLGYNAASTQGSMQNNAYTSAGVAGNSGNTFGSTGLGGMGAQWSGGQLNMNPGAMGGAANMFSQFSNSQGGMANMYGQGNVPGSVTGGFNNYNNQLNFGQNNANMGAGSAMGVMGMGQNMLQSANANQTSAYNTALSSAQAALNPQIQQQSNALLNSNFERGMSGTSGGALQTQALQNSFNTANLQAQNQAVGQGLNAFNSTINAGTGMFNSGAGQLGNFNNQGVNFGQQGMTGAMNYSAFSPQLAGMYQQNANSGVTGYSGINNAMLGNFQAGLGAITNQGTQANKAAGTLGGIGAGYQGGAQRYAAGVLGSPSGVSNLIGSATSLFNGLAGLGTPSTAQDPGDSLFSSGGTSQALIGQGPGLANFSMPTFQIPPPTVNGGSGNWNGDLFGTGAGTT